MPTKKKSALLLTLATGRQGPQSLDIRDTRSALLFSAHSRRHRGQHVIPVVNSQETKRGASLTRSRAQRYWWRWRPGRQRPPTLGPRGCTWRPTPRRTRPTVAWPRNSWWSSTCTARWWQRSKTGCSRTPSPGRSPCLELTGKRFAEPYNKDSCREVAGFFGLGILMFSWFMFCRDTYLIKT